MSKSSGKKESVTMASSDTATIATGVTAMSMQRNELLQEHIRGDFNMEDSPSYEILTEHKLLAKQYRIANETELVTVNPNSTRLKNAVSNIICCPLTCCGCISTFEVPNGCIKKGYDGRGNYLFFGPGVHQIKDPWYSVEPASVAYATAGHIVHGDQNIVTVPQGFIGYCSERGQPVLLPPGMHQWQSPMLTFERLIDLNAAVIPLGPWTLLTIDQGYMAVTQDNGKQMILDGGAVYLLTHRNWKFEKFVSTKIQTNNLERIEAASADNVVMLVDATVLWRIGDVETAVRMSAETMDADGNKAGKNNIIKLSNDVLKQSEASLAFFIGTINFSDTMAAAAIHQRRQDLPMVEVQVINTEPKAPATEGKVFNLYNNEKLSDAVAHANDITRTYGVEIKAINIISAIPKDKQLQASLAAGAVAAAEAQMMETTAQGKSRAIEIEASAHAKQTMILAQAEADADILRGEGARQAADLLATNPVAVDLAKIERTGSAIAGKGNHASFFFGANASHLSSLLANNEIVSRPM